MKLIYVIKGKDETKTRLGNRISFAVQGICDVIDGLIMVMSFGYLSGEFTYEFLKLEMSRNIRKRRNKDR